MLRMKFGRDTLRFEGKGVINLSYVGGLFRLQSKIVDNDNRNWIIAERGGYYGYTVSMEK